MVDPAIKATIKEVQKIVSVSDSTASNYIRYVRDVLNKPKPQIITITEFKKVFGIDEP